MGILIVDDEEEICDIIKYYLSEMGLHSDSINSPIHGLTMALENNYEIIITDYKMPQMTGMQLIKKCQEQLPIHTKYIIISGQILNDKIFAQGNVCEECKHVYFLAKPFVREQLTQLVSKCIEERV